MGASGTSFEDEDWIEAVRTFTGTGDFSRLHDLLIPVLRSVARKIASQCVEDAVQRGIVKVWRNADRVDLARPETVRPWLIKVGVRAMRDEVRRVLVRARERPDGEFDHREGKPAREKRFEFRGELLGEYVRFVEETGGTAGVHVHVARVMKTTPAKVQSEARSQILEQVKEQGGTVRSVDDAFDDLRRGRSKTGRVGVDPS
jgi:DNA-directed RNA polymerase specialized sigma24 family protein